MADTVFSELQDVLALEDKDGESAMELATRMALAANKLGDDVWQTLTEPTQVWVNDALTALENKADVPLPDGMTEKDAPHGAEKTDPETGEITAAAPKPKRVRKKAAPKAAPEKKAAAAKPAEPKPAAAPKAKAPAKAKPAKAAPAKKAKPANGTGTPGPKGTFSRTGKIKIVAKANPYREGTKSRGWFDVYKDGMTVEAAIAAGTPRHHIRWDLVQGNIKVS